MNWIEDLLTEKGWNKEQISAAYNALDVIEIDNYDYADNYRFARKDNHQECNEYDDIRSGGCCGFYDEEIIVKDGSVILVGFNYGH